MELKRMGRGREGSERSRKYGEWRAEGRVYGKRNRPVLSPEVRSPWDCKVKEPRAGFYSAPESAFAGSGRRM